MGSWDHVLELITEKLKCFTPVKRLCTIDGQIIGDLKEIEDKGIYVALEGSKGFQKVKYPVTSETNTAVLRSMLAKFFPRSRS